MNKNEKDILKVTYVILDVDQTYIYENFQVFSSLFTWRQSTGVNKQ